MAFMKIQLNDRVYDVLKWVCLIVLPACATFYVAVADIWGLGHIREVTATCVAVETFLGTILGVSTAQYRKGKEAECNGKCR